MEISELELPLQGKEKEYLNYLKLCKEKQTEAIRDKHSFIYKMEKLRIITVIFKLISTFLMGFELFLCGCMETFKGWKQDINNYILAIIIGIFILIFYLFSRYFDEKYTKLREKFMSIFKVNLNALDLEYLNNVLKDLAKESEVFSIIKANEKRYICDEGHMVDVTNISTVNSKEIIELKYYNISVKEKNYKSVDLLYDDIQVEEKFCYCANEINNQIKKIEEERL